MKKIVVILLSFVVFACAKYTTPRKVNNKLVGEPWSITGFIDGDTSILYKYNKVMLTFDENNGISSTSEGKVSGTWSVGTDKNPALLYMTFKSETDSMHVLTDDWVVYKLSKKECILKRNEGETFNYDASFNSLTLRRLF